MKKLSQLPRRAAYRIFGKSFGWLHRNYNALLGINTTYRLCKSINHLAYWKRMSLHRAAYLKDFDRLLSENGPVGKLPQNLLRDGWAIDRSGTLPYLQELLEQSDRLIAERAGDGAIPSEHKPFFSSLYKDGDLDRNPAFLDFVLSSEVLATVAHHMGCAPILSRDSPPGVRIMESNQAYSSEPIGVYTASQLYHLDLHDRPVVYVIVLLKDTTLDSGPWHFLPASVSQRARRLLRYQQKNEPYRISDERMYSVVDPEEAVVFTGKAGDVLFIESSSCFHFGSRDAVVPRYQLMYAFTTPCRGDLREWMYFGQRPEPTGSDSELRKMVLRHSKTARTSKG